MIATPPPFDFDLACAVALGLVEHPRLLANARQVTLTDQRGQTLSVHPNWLSPADPVQQLTLEFLRAREEAQKTTAKPAYGGWNATAGVKVRDEAVMRANAAKRQAAMLLAERGALTRASTLGLRILS